MREKGLSGISAMLNDQIEILGEITCKVKKYVLEIADVTVEADVRYRGNFYPSTPLVIIEFMGDKSDEIFIDDKYPFISNLKEIKNFRKLLIKVLLDKAEDRDDLPTVARMGIWQFVEDLKKFDEFKSKKAKLKESIDKLSEGNPEDQEVLNRLYSVLGLIPGGNRVLVKK